MSVLRNALLGLLAKRPMSGYDLTKQFDLSVGHSWSARHSQIYPELARLTEAGLIQPTGENGARGRKTYELTEAGLEQVRRWLVETEPERVTRNEITLRAFFLWLLEPEQARDCLRRERDVARQALGRLEEIETTFRPHNPTEHAARIALEAGIRQTRAVVEWAEWALEQTDGLDGAVPAVAGDSDQR